MSSQAAFAIILMLETTFSPVPPMAKSTTSFVMSPAYKTVGNCLSAARSFNVTRGSLFTGKKGTRYEGVKGTIVGAWCTVNRIVEGNYDKR